MSQNMPSAMLKHVVTYTFLFKASLVFASEW